MLLAATAYSVQQLQRRVVPPRVNRLILGPLGVEGNKSSQLCALFSINDPN
jgi:hypothetical protein